MRKISLLPFPLISLFRNRTLRFIALTLASIEVMGCATLEDIRGLRDLPGMTQPVSSGFYYDPSIRSYRLREKRWFKTENGEAVRDAAGKKVQTEEELARVVNSREREVLGTGTVVVVLGLFVIYAPIAIPLGIAQGVIAFPAALMLYQLQETYQEKAEKAYVSGREHFAAGKMDAALNEWEYARTVMPSLQAFSDIDYWRGRAFEAVGKTRDAQTAYFTFLSYSERSFPTYFKKPFSDDPLWEEKAKDAEKRIAAVKGK